MVTTVSTQKNSADFSTQQPAGTPFGSVEVPVSRKTAKRKTAGNTGTRTRVGFVFSNDPDPMLIERMTALEETGAFQTRAIYWHRGSDLSFPFSPGRLDPSRFAKVELRDPCAGPVVRVWLTLVFTCRLMVWIRRYNFEVLHVVYPNMLIAAFLATLGRRIEIVYDVWDANYTARMSAWQRAVFKLLLSKTRLVFTTSPLFMDEFLLPNCVVRDDANIEYISNAPYFVGRRSGHREGQRVAPGALVVGCVGNLRVPKQLQLLVDSVEDVRRTGRDVRIRFSGAGSNRQLASRAALQHSFVEYTGAYDYFRDAPSLYQQLDLVYAVYPAELFNYRVHIARRLHDAVLSATPIVVSRGTLMGELVKTQEIGWQIGDQAKEELVALLTSLHDDRGPLRAASENASRQQQYHSFSAFKESYVAAYKNLVCDSQSVAKQGVAAREKRAAAV